MKKGAGQKPWGPEAGAFKTLIGGSDVSSTSNITGIVGPGTDNRLAKFTSSVSVGDSRIADGLAVGSVATFGGSLTADRTYTLQNGSGTIAFTSDIVTYAPLGAQFVTLAADAVLTGERVFTAGAGIGTVDSGAGSAFTVSLGTTTVTAGSYGGSAYAPTFTVDAYGRLTAAGSAAISGGVTSVALAMPTQFAVSGTPVTSAGTLTAAWNVQAPNVVLAGPATGTATAAPTFRALTAADFPLPRSTGWAVTAGYTPDKIFNPLETTENEIARVLATLIDYLITRGDLSA